LEIEIMAWKARYGKLAMADRFDNYRGILSRYAGQCEYGKCTTKFPKGVFIGYHPGLKKVVCPDCWNKWQSENAEAALHEANNPQCCDGPEEYGNMY
jgi:hypothetical protein